MKQKKVQPTFVPKVEDDLDVSNIDGVFTNEQPTETPTDESLLQTAEKFD